MYAHYDATASNWPVRQSKTINCMENESILSKENLSKRTNADQQENATKTEHRSPVELKNFTIKDTSKKNDRSTTKRKTYFLSETAKRSNVILKTSDSFSKECNEKKNKSIQNLKERAVAETVVVDQPGKMPSLPNQVLSDGSKREIKIPGKINNAATTDTRLPRPVCDIIGKREQRREELKKMEGDLRQRLDMLECSMPAVMMWNIWKMSEGAPVCRIKRILEKQFKDARELSCRSTPSRHYDSRIRDAEAERKLALNKVEEARNLWSEKLVKLEEKRRKLEEAKRIQEEQKNAIERLSKEAKMLREEMEKRDVDAQQNGSCQYGECGDMKCRQRWLDKTLRLSSVTSIESGDIQCLEKIEQLAEEEVIIKRDIAELERREEAYMRTLQDTDEFWSKMEDEAVTTTKALKEQLDMKTAANQQMADRVCELEDALEKCRKKMAECRTQLEKFLSIEKIEATIGRDDDVAEVTDKEVVVRTRVVHRPIGRVDDVATVKDDEVLVRAEVADKEMFARPIVVDAEAEVTFVRDDKDITVKPDVIDLAVDHPADLVEIKDEEIAVRPEDLPYEQQKLKEVREYLAQLSSLEELYKEGEPCPPDFVCNDVVKSPTGMTDEELIALGLDPAAPIKKIDKKIPTDEERERQFREEFAKKANHVVDDIKKKEEKTNEILDVETKQEFVEKAVELTAVETPVREIVTRPAISEKVTDDSSITMPDDVKPEVKKIEQDIVIQRDTILSWIDTIDTIRTKTAKHPNCHAAKQDADTLAEQIGVYIGIKPKEIDEKDVTTITIEKEDRDTINEIKVKPEIETEEKFEEKNEIKFVSEIATKSTNDVITEVQEKIYIKPPIVETEIMETTKVTAEEAKSVVAKEIIDSTEVKAPNEVADVSKEAITDEVSKETDESKLAESKNEIEKLKETPQLNKVKTIEDATSRVEIIKTKEIAEAPPVVEIKEIERADIKETMPIMDDFKEVKEIVPETVSPAAELEKETEIEKFEPGKLSVDTEKLLTVDVAEKQIKVEESSQIVKEIEEKKIEIEQISIPEAIATEKVKIEEPVPSDVIQEKIEIAEPPPKDEIKLEEEPFPTVNEVTDKTEIIQPATEPPPLSIIKNEEQDIEQPVLAEVKPEEKEENEKIKETPKEFIVELPEEETIIEKLEMIQPVTESLPIIKDEDQEIEAMEKPAIEHVKREDEKIEVITKELISPIELPEEDKVMEKIEVIQPVTEPPPVIKTEVQEIEAMEKPVLEAKREEDKKMEEIPEELIPLTELTEKEKEEERTAKKEEVPKVIPPTRSLVEVKKETIPITIQEKSEIVEAEKITPTTETKPMEEGMPALQIDLRVAPQQYFIIAKIQEKEVIQILPVTTPQCMACCSRPPVETTAEPVAITRTEVVQTEVKQVAEIAQTEITQTEIVQTEVAQTEIVQSELVQISTQTVSQIVEIAPPTRIISVEYLKSSELETVVESSAEIVGGRPEITGRKMLEHKRLKDQSTVTTASTGSQTVETSHVSHERAVRDERERARVPTSELLRALKIAAQRTRLDTEREIRTINYGKSDEMVRQHLCNCCLCGKTPSSMSSSIKPELQIPQIDTKITKSPTAAALKRTSPRIDSVISYDGMCPDCKAKLLSKMSEKKRNIEQIIKVISRKKRIVEKRDQSCLAKISKRKTDSVKQKSKSDLPVTLEDTDKSDIKPLSSSCICFKTGKTGVGPTRKGNCYCAE
ncbi:titin-like [Pseudomyrmex gracilis]|uniref:titin-like n=1 Tax=Pseudomyrmex gracilis TaxID=219809 RepID=UPI0009954052|nr:titin-like [Pseudomyrmex gracilis]